jgi:NADH:ubiquinone oxidoreductase subunit 4 (subunit M)
VQHWLIATLDGICLGLALFACVRLRMHFGPIVRDRYGSMARRAYWLFTILLMIVLANLGLKLLRIYLSNFDAVTNSLMLEIWFALLALLLALSLIFKRLYWKR